ncbi:response regulator [Sedimentibacter hydroxybenzoicus DSM 7310]|uniref:Response regulator n=1 Tax=Sedimentibacter hydroxybenzoicus DSM 7310 TaxID=1123245 RepID=A0A974BGV6_SEDHY|nr:response regulator [Sedimentibacter hydroxybenzoicus]NYB72853.1 response regulator [Sedimentibacter hydroxybenzoicus DSM 7310]
MFRAVIADDEETIRNGLKKLIESYDLNLTVCGTAKDGEEALQLIKKYQPEIILMDINMPFMNGLEVIEKVKELDSDAKIIIISGYDKFNYAQRALELGVYSYLLKPIQFREFKNIITKAMDSYSKRMWEINKIKESGHDNANHKNIGFQVLNYIKEHFTQNDLTLNLMSERLHISQSYITKIVKEKTGANFTDYLNNLRINMAIKILLDKDNDYTINEIAEMAGYSSQHYFSRAFKNYTGLSPLQYKTKNKL